LSSDPIVGSFSPCPTCGKRGRRAKIIERKVPHIALGHRAWIRGRVGVYEAKCTCCKYFQSPIPGVPKGGKYSLEVRNMVANSLVRDRLPYRKVQERMQEDFCLSLSIGYIHNCFIWAHEQIDTAERRAWAVANFSGVLCIDEVHDSGRVLLYATDPISDFTVHFAINTSNDQDQMNAFLDELRAMGIDPQVIITDGSPLYKDALQEYWKAVEHQLCIFHVIKDINKLVLDALRSIKNTIKRQGNKGRKKKRGRRKKNAPKTSEKRTKKDVAKFLWENQHLIVRKDESLSDEEREALAEMKRIAPAIKIIRRFNQDFYRLFERGITQQQARYRRTRMVNNPAYQANPFLVRALRKLRKERFEKMIVFLRHGENAQRTSNHVERNNRSFRMMQKTRYKRRTELTIRMAIELDLYARMLRHTLFKEHDVLLLPHEPHRKVAA
jgi:transposase-like protein